MTATRNTVTVTLQLPSQVLSHNGRATWQAKHRATKDHQAMAAYAIRSILRGNHEPWTGPVRVHVRWFGRAGPIPDEPNVIERLSAYLDGCQHAGLFVNDRQISGITVERGYDRERPRCELVFTCEEG